MRRIQFALAMVCLSVLYVGQAQAMTIRAGIDPEYSPGTILIGEPFTVDIYMNNNDSMPTSDGYRLGATIPLAFYSPDDITNVTHVGIGGTTDPSVLYLNGFEPIGGFFDFTMLNYDSLWSWNGVLPDSFCVSRAAMMMGWPFNLGEQIYIRFGFQIDEAGTFCIDSAPRPPSFDWLFQAPSPDFNGPYCWTVGDTGQVNTPPVLASIGNREIDEGVNLNFGISATDADGDAITLRMESADLPPEATFTDNGGGSGTFDWTPTFDDAAIYNATFWASDGTDSVSEAIQITVNDVNRSPVLASIGNRETDEGVNLNFGVSATDADGDAITLRMESADLPPEADFTDNGDGTGTFDWTPTFDDAAIYNATFWASDGTDSASEAIQIKVNDANRPPVLASIGNQETDEEVNLNFGISATDADGDAITLRMESVNLPPAAVFTDNGGGSGTFDWTPTFDDAGIYDATFWASDGTDSVSEVIQIAVNNTNRLPVLASIGNRETDEGLNLNFGVSATDADGDAISLWMESADLPPEAAFIDYADGTGTFDWTPTFDDAGIYNATFWASDGTDSVSEAIQITVNDINRPPVLDQIAVGPLSVGVGESLILHITASDPDGTIPTLDTSPLMDNAAFFDSGNGAGSFEFYPDIAQSNMTYYVDFVASDGLLDDSETVEINVTEIGPCLEVTPDSMAFEGNLCDTGVTPQEQEMQYIHMHNCGGGTLSWTVSATEAWLAFNPNGGQGDDSVEVWIDWGNVPEIQIVPGSTVVLTDTLTVSAPGADNSPQLIRVDLILTCEPGQYVLSVDPTDFYYTVAAGDAFSDSFYVSEAYGQAVEFDVTNQATWLHIPVPFVPWETPIYVWFEVDTDTLPIGTFYDTIVVTAFGEPNNTPIAIPVTLVLQPGPEYTLVTDPPSFEFTLEIGESIIGESLFVSEATGASIPFDFEIAGTGYMPWVHVDSTGEMITPSVLLVNVYADDTLTIGDNFDTIFITSPQAANSPLAVPITLHIVAPYIVQTAPTSFSFILDEGESAVDTLLVFEVFGRSVGFLHQNFTTWLAVDPLAMPPYYYTTPYDLPIGVSTIGLAPGIYHDTILITPDVDSPVFPVVAVPVQLLVEEVGPVTDDSVWVSTVPGVPGSDAVVPVYFRNFETLQAINLPLSWSSDVVYLNEVTFDGTRVEYVDNKQVIIDNTSRRVLIDIAPTFTEDIKSGRGLMAKLHFSIAASAPPKVVIIDTTTIFPFDGLVFIDDNLNIIHPTYIPGGIVIDTTEGFICGRVIDTAGNEIEDATVELWDDFPAGYMMQSEMTDINGQFACHTTGISPFDAYAYKEGYYPGLVEGIQFGEIGIEIVLTPVSPVTPTNEWVDFYCDDNYYYGVPLPVGSVVDAYDPDGIHCGTFFVTTAGSYGVMPVYRDDPYTEADEGAEPGDEITFFINGYPADASGDRIWTEMGDNFEVCLDIFRVEDRSIPLHAGWNLISWNVDTPEDDIVALLDSISDCIEVVLGFEQGGLTYDPALPTFSTLWNMDHFHGYWVRMNCDTDLVVTGVPVAATTPIHVEAGWNLVSYLPDITDTIPHALSSIHDDLIVALGYVNDIGLTYDPSLPEYATLLHMMPGYGYWVKVMYEGDLIYPGVGPSVIFRQTPLLAARAARVSGKVTASRLWMDIYSYQLTLDENAVSSGTEVEIISSSGTVAGAGTVDENGLFGFVSVYGDDPSTPEKEGLAGGEEFRLVIDGVETAESFSWTGVGDRLEIGPLTTRTGGATLPSQFGLEQNYPNPFNPATTVLFSLPEPMHATLEVYNILGKKVKTIFDGMGKAGANSVVWHGDDSFGEPVASGVYLYRIKAGAFEKTRKMVLMK
jgi:hypothetical protein